jgi:hypothetical protein
MVAPTGQPPADQSEPEDESGRPDSNGNNPGHRQASPWRMGMLLSHDHQNGCYPHSAQDHPSREQKALYPVHLIPLLSLSEHAVVRLPASCAPYQDCKPRRRRSPCAMLDARGIEEGSHGEPGHFVIEKALVEKRLRQL